MDRTLSRRTLLATAGIGVLSATAFPVFATRAQESAQSHSFPNSNELIWVAPWTKQEEQAVAEILPDSIGLQGGNQGELIVGYYAASTDADTSANAFLSLLLDDTSQAVSVAGGGTTSTTGEAPLQSEYRVYHLTADGQNLGLYVQLDDGLGLTVFLAPVSNFASEMTSAHDSVTLNGTGVLDGVDGAALQLQLEALADSAAWEGEYTDESGVVHVQWRNGWTIVSQDEFGIELTNPVQSIIVGTQRVSFDGRNWQQAAESLFSLYTEDQGPAVTASELVVTDSSISFVTDGQYGPRMVQAIPSDNPELFVQMLAIEFDPAQAAALLDDVRGSMLVNGNPPLQGLDQLISILAS